jgi:hypothetical protein
MSGGATYLGLLAALRQEELLDEAMRRRHSTEVLRTRRGNRIASLLSRPFRAPKR